MQSTSTETPATGNNNEQNYIYPIHVLGKKWYNDECKIGSAALSAMLLNEFSFEIHHL